MNHQSADLPDKDLSEKIIVVHSSGSGARRSEIAASIGYLLAQTGLNVWLIDADLYTPTLDYLLKIPITSEKKTLSYFLIDEKEKKLPLELLPVNENKGVLYLTPSDRNDPDIRFKIQEMVDGASLTCPGSYEDLSGRITSAITKMIDENGIDYLIIDTNPSFEPINDIWFGMAGIIIMLSRLNGYDEKNLVTMLQTPDISDIKRKIVAFADVSDNIEKVTRDYNNFKQAIDHLSNRDGFFIADNITFSQRFKLHDAVESLFVKEYPNDLFTKSVMDLLDMTIPR